MVCVWRCGGVGIVHRVSVCVCAGSVDKQRGAFGWELAKSTAPKVFRGRLVFMFMVIWDVSAVINCQNQNLCLWKMKMDDG